MEPLGERALGGYQCGFRRGTSNTNQISTIRYILEKWYQYNVTLHHLSIDNNQAYDYLSETTRQLGIPDKILRLVKMIQKESTSKVTIGEKNQGTLKLRKALDNVT